MKYGSVSDLLTTDCDTRKSNFRNPGLTSLIFNSLMNFCLQLKQMLSEHYDKLSQIVLDIAHSRDLSKNTHVQKALLRLLPKLAAFQRQIFVSKYLKSTTLYMDKLLQGREPSNAYIAIGLLAVATGKKQALK